MSEDDKKVKFVVDNTPVSNAKTASETLLRTQRKNVISQDQLSASSLKKLSDIRKGEIHESYSRSLDERVGKSGSPVVGVSMGKKADFGAMPVNKGVDRLMPELYSPLFQTANLNLPRDRMTMNAWNRNFYDTNAIVRNAITMHATYPISKINVKCKYRHVEQFFNDMAARIDLFNVIADASLEFWKHGEQVHGITQISLFDGTTKAIKDIKIGDEVLTHLGNKKKVIDKFIKPTHRVKDEVKIYKIKVLGLPEPLIISGQHPIFALAQEKIACITPSCKKKNMRVWPGTEQCSNCNKKYTNKEMPDFIKTNEIKINDLACASFNWEVIDNNYFTPELCYLMGFWAAEGCYTKNKKNEYTGIKIIQYNKDFLRNKIEPLFKIITGKIGKLYTSFAPYLSFGKMGGNVGKKCVYHFESEHRGGPQLAQLFLEHCGEYSQEKKLSETIMYLPTNLQLQILAGFIDGDGCVDQSNGHIIISTTSQNLANQFMLLLRRCDIRPTMSKIIAKKENESDEYRIKIVANEAYDNFYNLLKSDKKDKLRKTEWSTQRTILQKNWQLLPIQSIEDITNTFIDGLMYDIEVEDDHSYIANGIAIHNCFTYAQLDESLGAWSSIVIQNPDYVTVKKSGVSNTSIISLRPDEALKKIVSSNHPADIKLRSQIPDNIIHHIRKNEPIPLDNFNVSHLKMTSSPYETRGTSIIVSCYKPLMLFDKLFECELAQADSFINPITIISVGGTGEGEFHPGDKDLEAYREIFECYDEETEVLTKDGFKKYHEVIDYTLNKNGKYIALPKDDVEIACFNSETEKLEYYKPQSASLYDYDGEMYHFKNKKVDIKVTPNHDMWVSKKMYSYNGSRELRTTYWGEWNKVKADKIELADYSRFRSKISWDGEKVDFVDILDKKMPIDLYLEFLGYVLSEGCLYGKTYSVMICQTFEKYYTDMKSCADKFADVFDKKCRDRVRKAKVSNHHDLWSGTISYKLLYDFMKKEVSDVENTTASYKRVPRWILNLSPSLLKILLEAIVKGDGSFLENKDRSIPAYTYYTTSKQLADDVYEMVYKCGYVPTMVVRDDYDYMGDNRLPLYTLCWSSSDNGKYPLVYKNNTDPRTKEKKELLSVEQYKGKVWCFATATGLFITRRNGKITIQGNSAQGDKDFKIITHAAMKVERVGASGAVIDTASKFNFIKELLYAGLMVPKAVMDTEGSSYASASIGLEVLRTRYITFRNMLEQWLEKKIFAPISQIQGFFEYRGGEKVLIVPEVDWNHINLYDLNDYIQALNQYVEKNRISTHTLYRSLGLNWEEEQRLIREEMVRNTILAKESEQLKSMTLTELRALNPDEAIAEVAKEEAIPGTPESTTGELGSEELGDMSGLSSPPPMPELSVPGAAGAPPEGGGMPAEMGAPPTGTPAAAPPAPPAAAPTEK